MHSIATIPISILLFSFFLFLLRCLCQHSSALGHVDDTNNEYAINKIILAEECVTLKIEEKHNKMLSNYILWKIPLRYKIKIMDLSQIDFNENKKQEMAQSHEYFLHSCMLI